ncbi:response regulator [Marinirhabdus gelatinilytica]|uniref:histidine kinase n=1 Tax=Marinirhabdus gelatinilytica TaxID=1703343 RepID=A0A370QIL4_9FLAO|nr:response regulator [Marinirhabdus gelatinilytica]RDK88204.1 phospho-acceptor domain-containing protein [Marinirhabdus gelatinilytica]
MKKLYFFFLFTLSLQCATVLAQADSLTHSGKLKIQQLIDSSETYYISGNYKKSMEVNVKILNKAFELGDANLIHKGYRFLGYDFLALEDIEMAKENFLKSERYATESKNDTAIAITYMDLANLYSFEEDGYEKSMRYHKKSIKGFKKIKDTASLAKAHYNTVVTAFSFERYKSGLYHLIKAEFLERHNPSPSFKAGIKNLYGDYYKQKGAHEKAEKAFLKAIALGKEHKLTAELEISYRGYSDVLFTTGRFEEAYNTREKYEEYLLENREIAKSAASGSAASKFQLAEYQKIAEDARLKNVLQAELMETNRRTNKFLWVATCLGLLVTLYLWYAYRRRKALVRELRVKNKEYLRAKQKSDQLAKSKAKFFSTVSHELRTPLYGVIGLSTILLENEELKKHEKDLKSLKFSADYLLALINDVLQMNKIENDSHTSDAAAFNLRELIDTIVSSFEYMRIQHKNEINVHISKDIPQLLKGSSVRLSQVLMNLIGNACKFTEEGVIDVIASVSNASEKTILVTFTVKDTGSGIEGSKLETIFDEFSQIESGNKDFQGTGLGLPIVKKLLEQSNSDITVTSELGKGTKFQFNLLFDIAQLGTANNLSPVVDTSMLSQKSILVVEDNRINQMVTKKILEKEKVQCDIAKNGKEAITMVKQNNYDLVLMDINMPVMNGIDATKKIREFNNTIPIIALTAVEVDEIRFRIFDSGMNDIIVKPYDVEKFRQTIAKNLLTGNVPNKISLKAI